MTPQDRETDQGRKKTIKETILSLENKGGRGTIQGRICTLKEIRYMIDHSVIRTPSQKLEWQVFDLI